MGRMRVHELAGEMDIDPRLIIEEGRKHGIVLRDVTSELSTSDVFILRAFLRDAPRRERPPAELEASAGSTPENAADADAASVVRTPGPVPGPAAPVAPTACEDPVPGPPQPHVVGAALETGQVVWARVAGAQATLRSGGRLQLTTRPVDGIEGWRPVRIINSEKLLATALPVAGPPLPELEADDPSALWPMPEASAPLLDRPGTFPAGLARGLMKRSVAWTLAAAGAALALAVGILIGRAVA